MGRSPILDRLVLIHRFALRLDGQLHSVPSRPICPQVCLTERQLVVADFAVPEPVAFGPAAVEIVRHSASARPASAEPVDSAAFAVAVVVAGSCPACCSAGPVAAAVPGSVADRTCFDFAVAAAV